MKPETINWIEQARKKAPLLFTMLAFFMTAVIFIYINAISDGKKLEQEREQEKIQKQERLR